MYTHTHICINAHTHTHTHTHCFGAYAILVFHMQENISDYYILMDCMHGLVNLKREKGKEKI